MEKFHDIVPVQLKGDHQDLRSPKKSTEKLRVAFRIKDSNKNRDIYVYNGIDRQILHALMKEL